MNTEEKVGREFFDLFTDGLSFTFRKWMIAGGNLTNVVVNFFPMGIVISVDVNTFFIFSKTEISFFDLLSTNGVGIKNDLEFELLIYTLCEW
jgi:hypothetical protein